MKTRTIKLLLLAISIIISCEMCLVGCSLEDGINFGYQGVDFGDVYKCTLKVGETYQLSHKSSNPDESTKYYSTDEKLATVSKDGLITAVAPGLVGIDTEVLSGNSRPDEKFSLLVEIVSDAVPSETPAYNITKKGYFDVSYGTQSWLFPGDTISLNARFVTPDGTPDDNISWKTDDTSIAAVDNSGNVTGLRPGVAKITATAESFGKTFDFSVTVLNSNLCGALKEVVLKHNSNPLTVPNLNISYAYNADIIESVNDILFADFVLDSRYYDVLKIGEKNDGEMEKIEYITVHYTGNPNAGADADNNASYFNELSYSASIHYVTGRTNVDNPNGGYTDADYRAFNVLNEKYAGWHASGYGYGPHEWIKTGIKYSVNDPKTPVISINRKSFFTINGKPTTVMVPDRQGLTVSGPSFRTYGASYPVFNKQGIACTVIDGEYCIGNTYWNPEYKNMLSNIGGNLCSIGIESCVDEGSDLMHTWHLTAQLVARLMLKHNLDITRVQGHHFFAGKDCPQPLLENNMQLWDKFIEYVNAEYDVITKFRNEPLSFEILDSGNDNLYSYGLLRQDKEPHCVTYKVTCGSQSVVLSTIVPPLSPNSCAYN